MPHGARRNKGTDNQKYMHKETGMHSCDSTGRSIHLPKSNFRTVGINWLCGVILFSNLNGMAKLRKKIFFNVVKLTWMENNKGNGTRERDLWGSYLLPLTVCIVGALFRLQHFFKQ